MSKSTFFIDEEKPEILFDQEYTPDHPNHIGETYKSYNEMMAKCPEIEARKVIMEKRGEQYTPYTHRFVPRV